jgi:hypothetical protein
MECVIGQACARNTSTYVCGTFTETGSGVGAGLMWFWRRLNGRGYILDPVKLTVSNRITDNHAVERGVAPAIFFCLTV